VPDPGSLDDPVRVLHSLPVGREHAVDRVLGSGRTVAAQVVGVLPRKESHSTKVTRALAERDGPGPELAVWERAGMPLDLVSAPVLTWALPLVGGSAVAEAARAMTGASARLDLPRGSPRR
jgi:hypothetical protein